MKKLLTLIFILGYQNSSFCQTIETEINLSNYYDSGIAPGDSKGNYPVIGVNGLVTIGNVNFQTNTQNALLRTIGGGVTDKVTINTDITDATIVNTLINSSWGNNNVTTGSITFNASNGEFQTYYLVEGSNIRDHFNGAYINIVTSSEVIGTLYTIPSRNERLDAQAFVLDPSIFGNATLTSIVFANYGLGISGGGSPFLAAATVTSVSSVPLPETLPLFTSALAGITILIRRTKL